MARAGLFVVLLTAPLACAPLDERDEMDASALLARMRAAYAACDTYADVGLLETQWSDDSNVSRTLFSTTLARPDQLRFQFWKHSPWRSEPWKTSILRARGADVRTFHSGDAEEERCDDLSLAAAGFTGISSSTVLMIPPLLRSDVRDTSILVPDDPETADDVEVDGTPCYEIRGVHRHDSGMIERITLRVGKRDSLLREAVVETHRPIEAQRFYLEMRKAHLERLEREGSDLADVIRQTLVLPTKDLDEESIIRIRPQCGEHLDERVFDTDPRDEQVRPPADARALLDAAGAGPR